MLFPFGQTVHRQRPEQIPDPYNPDRTVPGDWANAPEVEIEGAFVGPTSTSLLATATREQASESRSLFCDDDADVRKGDRIRVGDTVYTIDGIPPDQNVNPWTNWSPPREIPLTRHLG